MDLEEMITRLPYIDCEADSDEYEVVEEDEGYSPTLYKYDDMWHLDWMSQEEGDSLVDFTGYSPTEAVTKAYDFCISKHLI